MARPPLNHVSFQALKASSNDFLSSAGTFSRSAQPLLLRGRKISFYLFLSHDLLHQSVVDSRKGATSRIDCHNTTVATPSQFSERVLNSKVAPAFRLPSGTVLRTRDGAVGHVRRGSSPCGDLSVTGSVVSEALVEYIKLSQRVPRPWPAVLNTYRPGYAIVRGGRLPRHQGSIHVEIWKIAAEPLLLRHSHRASHGTSESWGYRERMPGPSAADCVLTSAEREPGTAVHSVA